MYLFKLGNNITIFGSLHYANIRDFPLFFNKAIQEEINTAQTLFVENTDVLDNQLIMKLLNKTKGIQILEKYTIKLPKSILYKINQNLLEANLTLNIKDLPLALDLQKSIQTFTYLKIPSHFLLKTTNH